MLSRLRRPEHDELLTFLFDTAISPGSFSAASDGQFFERVARSGFGFVGLCFASGINEPVWTALDRRA